MESKFESMFKLNDERISTLEKKIDKLTMKFEKRLDDRSTFIINFADDLTKRRLDDSEKRFDDKIKIIVEMVDERISILKQRISNLSQALNS